MDGNDIQQFGDRQHYAMGVAVDMQRVWATIAAAAGTTVPYSGDISTIYLIGGSLKT